MKRVLLTLLAVTAFVVENTLDVAVPVLPTAADAYLLDLRWPGVFILDGQTGGFCGLAKRWTYAN